MLPSVSPKKSIELPEMSWRVWEELLAHFPVASGNHYALFPFTGLKVSALPGWEKVALQPNDDWVILYEKLMEKAGKAQRKQGLSQSGVFYTPLPVAGYLIKRTLGAYLDRSLYHIQNSMSCNQLMEAEAVLRAVQNVRVIDPACGTGTFLAEALNTLLRFYRQVAKEFPVLSDQSRIHHALAHQINGIDIDPLSVVIAELRLMQQAYRLTDQEWAGISQTLLPQACSLKCADTLTEPGISGSAWDFILGNPPYVSEVRKQSTRLSRVKNTAYYQAKMDLCDAFIAWALDHLTPQGQVAYVLPEYWAQRTSTAPLRSRLWQAGQIQELWTFNGEPIFKNAPGHHSSLLIWQKTDQPSPVPEQSGGLGLAWDISMLTEDNLKPSLFSLDPVTTKLRYGSHTLITLLAQLSSLPLLLPKTAIQQGIVIPQGRLKKTDRQRLPQGLQAELPMDTGIFLLDASETKTLSLNDAEQKLLKPYYSPTDFQTFTGFTGQAIYQLIYTDAPIRKVIAAQPETYPHIRQHLDQFRPILSSAFAPYGLHRPRQPVWFEDAKKIFCPRQVMMPAFAVVDFPAYVNEGFYIIRVEDDLDYLCALLNSTLGWFWFYQHKRKGHRLQIDKDVLCTFPAPANIPRDLKKQLIEMAQKLAKLGLSQSAMSELDALVYQAYQLSEKEIELIENARRAIGS